jgi:hypothetical protein
MDKNRLASSGDSTSGEMIRIGYLYDRRTIVLLIKKVIGKKGTYKSYLLLLLVCKMNIQIK